MTRARGRTNLKISVLLVCCALGRGTAQSNGGFVMEDGRLPYLATGHNTMTFATSGAWLLTWRGKDLLSGGITFREKGWLRWGTQMRRTSNDDAFEASSEDIPGLKFSNTLKDLKRSKLFEIQQSVTREKNELRFEYQLKALVDIESEVLGAEFELPLKEFFAQGLRLRFDKRIVPIPTKEKGQMVGWFIATELAVLKACVPVVKMKVPAGTLWYLLDDRPFNLNVARARFGIPVKDKKITKGQTFRLGYTVLLPPGNPAVALGSYGLDFTESGGLTIHHLTSGKIAELALQARKEGQPQSLEAKSLLPPARSATGIHFAGSLQVKNDETENEKKEDATVVPYRLRAVLTGKTMNLIWRFPRAGLSEDWQLGILYSAKSALKIAPNPQEEEKGTTGEYVLNQTKGEVINLKADTSAELQPIESEGESRAFVPLALSPLGGAEKSDYMEARVSIVWKAAPKQAQ